MYEPRPLPRYSRATLLPAEPGADDERQRGRPAEYRDRQELVLQRHPACPLLALFLAVPAREEVRVSRLTKDE